MGPMEGIKYEVWAEIDLNECFLDSLYGAPFVPKLQLILFEFIYSYVATLNSVFSLFLPPLIQPTPSYAGLN